MVKESRTLLNHDFYCFNFFLLMEYIFFKNCVVEIKKKKWHKKKKMVGDEWTETIMGG